MNVSLKASIATIAMVIAASAPAKAEYVITKEKSFPSVAFIEFDPRAEPEIVVAPKEDVSFDELGTFTFPTEATQTTGIPHLIEGMRETVQPVVDGFMNPNQNRPVENVEQRVEDRVREMQLSTGTPPQMPPLPISDQPPEVPTSPMPTEPPAS